MCIFSVIINLSIFSYVIFSTLPPSKGKGDRGKGKGSVDSSLTANIKAGSKDKDRRDSAGTSSEKELRGDSIDLKDCPLRLPEFANVDHAKLVPRYTSGKGVL